MAPIQTTDSIFANRISLQNKQLTIFSSIFDLYTFKLIRVFFFKDLHQRKNVNFISTALLIYYTTNKNYFLQGVQ